MRYLFVTLLVLASLSPVAAETFTPISGPNDAIPSPVCDLINFGFCPQPARPAPFPDPQAEAAVVHPLPPPPVRQARIHHRRTPSFQ